VVVPLKMTVVPEVSLVRSSVVPAGTAMLLKVIVEHAAFPLMAAAAVVKVQDARCSRDWEVGAAATRAPALSRMVERNVETMLAIDEELLKRMEVFIDE
jgi:hypothetical protein